jgi:hypothetical protein
VSFGKSLTRGRFYAFELTTGGVVSAEFQTTKALDGAVVVKTVGTGTVIHLNPAHVVLAREGGQP